MIKGVSRAEAEAITLATTEPGWLVWLVWLYPPIPRVVWGMGWGRQKDKAETEPPRQETVVSQPSYLSRPHLILTTSVTRSTSLFVSPQNKNKNLEKTEHALPTFLFLPFSGPPPPIKTSPEKATQKACLLARSLATPDAEMAENRSLDVCWCGKPNIDLRAAS
ncbi:uncharacterized protein H6S33_007693 [Morchella sextelata]|uniref:uncharacterized protein n=1 Tax=Morchella sextelata TaxID=1174677 RepID=UPI001D03CB86|nr:uncharacterized protein H6S33_007693 [Morchella sextelata]KAH0603371.1 hypothetical protein H6S33_007693 [Morchella sextelata]